MNREDGVMTQEQWDRMRDALAARFPIGTRVESWGAFAIEDGTRGTVLGHMSRSVEVEWENDEGVLFSISPDFLRMAPTKDDPAPTDLTALFFEIVKEGTRTGVIRPTAPPCRYCGKPKSEHHREGDYLFCADEQHPQYHERYTP